MTKTELFLHLAKPNEDGKTGWIDISKFVGDYADLKFGNGASWARKESKLAKNYIVEFDKDITPGNGIDRVRLNGKQTLTLTQNIRSDIKRVINNQRCVVMGVSKIEIDHKNGRKMNAGGDARVLNTRTQEVEDFQPLSKAANDAKRQHCKECTITNDRFDAKRLGYSISYYYGKKTHNLTSNGCIGCFWFDPIEFRKHLKGL